MIENYQDKKQKGQVEFAFAESGNIAIIERRFDETNGLPVMRPTQEVSAKQLEDLIEDNARQMTPFVKRDADLKALLTDVQAEEKKRDDLIAAKKEGGSD